MANKLSPVYNDSQFIDGIPAVGAKVFTYQAGSTTPQTTYADEAGTTPNPNPIILNARGEPPQPFWLIEGQSYKFVFTSSTDTDPPTSPIRTLDNIIGVGDNMITVSQWQSVGVTPTYINANTFTVAGDQTNIFTVGLRVKLNVTAGTVYGTITSSVYNGSTITTVTVALDSGALDSGLSSVQIGLITPDNSSIPSISDLIFRLFNFIDNTKKLAFNLVGITTGTTRTWSVQDKDITVAGLEDTRGGSGLGSKFQSITATVAANALTITLNPTSLDFRSTTLQNGVPSTVTLSTATSIVIPDTATLGTLNTVPARLTVIAINNAGAIELAVVNATGGFNLDETGLISTVAITTAADNANVAYSTTLRAGVAYRVVGYIDITEAVAGTWATAPTVVQGAGCIALAAMASIGYGQTWQNVIGSRAFNTTYYNTTGKPIMVQIGIAAAAVGNINVGGVAAGQMPTGPSTGAISSVIVPPGSTYSLVGSGSINTWTELR